MGKDNRHGREPAGHNLTYDQNGRLSGQLLSADLFYIFSVCKDLCTSFSNDMQGMFLYVQKR